MGGLVDSGEFEDEVGKGAMVKSLTSFVLAMEFICIENRNKTGRRAQ